MELGLSIRGYRGLVSLMIEILHDLIYTLILAEFLYVWYMRSILAPAGFLPSTVVDFETPQRAKKRNEHCTHIFLGLVGLF